MRPFLLLSLVPVVSTLFALAVINTPLSLTLLGLIVVIFLFAMLMPT